MGERMSGLKRISSSLSKMFNNIEEHLDSFVILFNKYINRANADEPVENEEIDKMKANISAQLKDAYQ